MERTKRIPITRTVTALTGALAILALVAGPSLAHPAAGGASRIYEPAVSWSTQATVFGARTPASAADDENDADELRAEEDSADEQEADQDNDDQGVDDNQGADNQGADEDPGDQGAGQDQGDQGAGQDQGDQGAEESDDSGGGDSQGGDD
jgi:hypothetical protein